MRGVVVGVSAERSIGFACARALGDAGADVAITYRPQREGTVLALAARIGVLAVPLELDDPRSITAAFAFLERAYGHLDFLVHTLMHVPPGLLERPLTELDRDGFHRVLDVGVHSLVVLCRHARPLLARSEAPRVVTISSPCGHRMTPHYHVAGIAKAALEATLLYLAHELGPERILCNAVSTSFLATDGALRAVGEQVATGTRAVQAKKSATGRAVDFEEVAGSRRRGRPSPGAMGSPWLAVVLSVGRLILSSSPLRHR